MAGVSLAGIWAGIGAIGAGSAIAGVTIGMVIQGAIIGAAVGGLAAAVTGGDIGKGLLFGAVGGAVIGAVSGAIGGVSAGSASGMTSATLDATAAGTLSGSTGTAISGAAGGATSSAGGIGSLLNSETGATVVGSVLSEFGKAGDLEDAAEFNYQNAKEERQNRLEQIKLQNELQGSAPITATDNASLSQRESEFARNLEENRRQYNTTLQEGRDKRNMAASTLEQFNSIRGTGNFSANPSVLSQTVADRKKSLPAGATLDENGNIIYG